MSYSDKYSSSSFPSSSSSPSSFFSSSTLPLPTLLNLLSSLLNSVLSSSTVTRKSPYFPFLSTLPLFNSSSSLLNGTFRDYQCIIFFLSYLLDDSTLLSYHNTYIDKVKNRSTFPRNTLKDKNYTVEIN